ncbi:MAG: DUF86 domain-containing protein [Anaerolineaceae bacterium]|nr:DUF86 domain-containing protein [Anaerolineaceae bacterium]
MKDNRLYLIHIKECLDKIYAYLGATDKSGFLSNEMLQDAVIRNLQIMSESTQRISEELKEKYPNIEWHKISGFRNIVVHEYLNLDAERVWLVIENDLPPLRKTIEKMLEEN